MADLTGRRVLGIVTSYGVEQDELVVPLEHLRAAGAEVVVASNEPGEVRTLVGDKDPGRSVPVDVTYGRADPADADLLLVPGGTLNADTLRLQDAAVDDGAGFPLVTSRTPDDLDDFLGQVDAVLGA